MRQPSFSQPTPQENTVQVSQQRKRPLEDSQEWILFAPASLSASQTNTSQTARTANLSRASDFGSLETRGRSDQIRSQDEDLTCQGTEAEDDDNEDLDSLDDGLHAFQAPPQHLDQSGGSVLPNHDGLGTFPTSYAYAGNEGTQEQLWQYERYNPHRRRSHHRRRSSVQRRIDAMGQDDETLDPQEERRQRVEKWRLEQSKAVVEEIERETRRRQRRIERHGQATNSTKDTTLKVGRAGSGTKIDIATHPNAVQSGDKEETESFWQRITRRVIRDLIGLDENTLSVIFGEELPDELSATPTQTSPIMESIPESSLAAYPGRTWEQRLVERIARELGILVHQLSEVEGAFSTYTAEHVLSPTPTTAPPITTSRPTRTPAIAIAQRHGDLTISDTLFAPTLPQTHISPNTATEASLWGLEEEASSPAPNPAPTNATTEDPDYWSRDLDVRMIFDYLRTRFSSRPSSPAPQPTTAENGPLPSNWATSTTASALGTSPESLRRADLIRRNHPLVSRAVERRRESLLKRHHTAMLHRRTGSSSCASQSTKRSRTSTGASRKYWDFPGGSAGSIATSANAGGVREGGWGEV